MTLHVSRAAQAHRRRKVGDGLDPSPACLLAQAQTGFTGSGASFKSVEQRHRGSEGRQLVEKDGVIGALKVAHCGVAALGRGPTA